MEMTLQAGTLLKNGEYRIVRALGQGGFGITYEAEQVALGRKVAVKEFFMKDCCERDATTSSITVGTGSQRELVEKFRGKFVREARMIASLRHSHIVSVIDVFEENDTAYYVMENLSGGSLSDAVAKQGPLSESAAMGYIRQVGEALSYLHARNLVHLDVKPSNILLNDDGEAVLIDFGVSKHYDNAGEQTSSTPVGLSKGYAPLEQGRDGDVSQFTPSTDIYALGATLYHLVTGIVPPEASIIYEDGLGRPAGISDGLWKAIEAAMQPRRKDRPQSVAAFLSLLPKDSPAPSVESAETTIIHGGKDSMKGPKKKDDKKPNRKALYYGLSAAALFVAIALIFGISRCGGKKASIPAVSTDTLTTVVDPVEEIQEPVKPAEPEVIKVTGIKLSKTALELEEGGTAILATTITPKNATDQTVTWKSYNEQVATVSKSGKVTAKKAGSATIVARCGDQETSCNVTVKEKQTRISTTSSTGSSNGHDWVDLGLSVKWATCNVGASKPEEYGNYYAWGETSRKSDYSWSNLKYCTVTTGDHFNKHFNKYVPSGKSEYWSGSGSPDNKTRLEYSDDAARQNWGGNWRMPTDAEWEELETQCTWTWTTQAGKNVHIVTAKNGNSIVLPDAGCRDGTGFDSVGSGGYYWSSSLDMDYPPGARCAKFSFSAFGERYHCHRYYGFSVRPVIE